MALSGTSASSGFGTNSQYKLQLEWSATQNITNNTSTVVANLYLISGDSTYNIVSGQNNRTAKITIDGTVYTKTTVNIDLAGGQKKLIHTATKVVSHNSDGSKTFSISASSELLITFTSYVGTVSVSSASTALNTIPRTSTFTGFANFTLGTNPTITITSASSTFTHDVSIYCGSTFIGQWMGLTGGSNTLTLNATHLERIYALIPNSTTITLTLNCATMSGTTKTGTKSATATATIPASVVPTISEFSGAETVTTVSSTIGAYVQNLSKIKFKVVAGGANNSTISSYSIVYDGSTFASATATTEALKSSGTITATAKVTDSRGRTATKTLSVVVLAYSVPKITAFTVDRSNTSGTLADMGTSAKLILTGSITSLSSKNSFTIKTYSKLRSATSWTTLETINGTVGAAAISLSKVYSTYVATTSYDFRVDVADKFNTTMSLLVLSTGEVTMSWNKNGVGVGKINSGNYSLDVGGDMSVDNSITIGSVILKTDTTNGTALYSNYKGYFPGLELRGVGTPYLDFSNDLTSDYIGRIILTDSTYLDVVKTVLRANAGLRVGSVFTVDSSGNATATSLTITNATNKSKNGGYAKLNNGMILQWGNVDVTTGTAASVTFPIAFPVAIGGTIQLTGNYTNSFGYALHANSASLTGFSIIKRNGSDATAVDTIGWFVVGW